jgi:hypothetical protein
LFPLLSGHHGIAGRSSCFGYDAGVGGLERDDISKRDGALACSGGVDGSASSGARRIIAGCRLGDSDKPRPQTSP